MDGRSQQVNLVTTKLANRLQIPFSKRTIQVGGIGQLGRTVNETVWIHITFSSVSKQAMRVSCY